MTQGDWNRIRYLLVVIGTYLCRSTTSRGKETRIITYQTYFNLQTIFKQPLALGLKRDDTFFVMILGHCIEMDTRDMDAYIGTNINDKVRGNLNTSALMKMLNTSEPGDHLATPRLEDTSITSVEMPLSNQDKMMLETPL